MKTQSLNLIYSYYQYIQLYHYQSIFLAKLWSRVIPLIASRINTFSANIFNTFLEVRSPVAVDARCRGEDTGVTSYRRRLHVASARGRHHTVRSRTAPTLAVSDHLVHLPGNLRKKNYIRHLQMHFEGYLCIQVHLIIIKCLGDNQDKEKKVCCNVKLISR